MKGDTRGLYKWMIDQRQAYKRPEDHPRRLSAERLRLLVKLPGWTWQGRFERERPTKQGAPGTSTQPRKKPRMNESESDDDGDDSSEEDSEVYSVIQ